MNIESRHAKAMPITLWDHTVHPREGTSMPCGARKHKYYRHVGLIWAHGVGNGVRILRSLMPNHGHWIDADDRLSKT